MKRLKAKLVCLLLMIATVISTLTVTDINPAETKAAQKAHCASLKLNNDIKLNKTKTFKKKGFIQEYDLFPKKKSVNVNYTIKCSRKKAGNNYKVTYSVNYKFPDNPKIVRNILSDYYKLDYEYFMPSAFYTVFDYQTGKTLEEKNKLGVKVKGSKWKYTYYPKQYFNPPGDRRNQGWTSNYKSISYSFTVTYPKKCKDVVVGIGFSNISLYEEGDEDNVTVNQKYWNGKAPYGKTDYYKKGKKTMSYMRLNK